MIFAWMNARVDVDIERKREKREKGKEKKERREGETNSGLLFYMVSQTGAHGLAVCLSLSFIFSTSLSRLLSRSLFFSNLPCLPFAEATKVFDRAAVFCG